MFEFQGCIYPGYATCFPNRETRNPVNHMLMEDLYAKTVSKGEKLRAEGFVVIEMWACVWEERKEKEPAVREFVDGLGMVEPLE